MLPAPAGMVPRHRGPPWRSWTAPRTRGDRRGRWAEGSTAADTVYDRTLIKPEDDSLSKVPLGGHTEPV